MTTKGKEPARRRRYVELFRVPDPLVCKGRDFEFGGFKPGLLRGQPAGPVFHRYYCGSGPAAMARGTRFVAPASRRLFCLAADSASPYRPPRGFLLPYGVIQSSGARDLLLFYAGCGVWVFALSKTPKPAALSPFLDPRMLPHKDPTLKPGGSGTRKFNGKNGARRNSFLDARDDNRGQRAGGTPALHKCWRYLHRAWACRAFRNAGVSPALAFAVL